MHDRDMSLLELPEPEDYFKGVGREMLPTPVNVLLFMRRARRKLQQEALQNRSHHRFVLAFNRGTRGTVHVDHLALPFSCGQALLIHPFQFHHFSQLESDKLEWLFCTFELPGGGLLKPLRNRVFSTGEHSRRATRLLLEEWQRCARDRRAGTPSEASVQSALLQVLLSLKQDLLASATDLRPPPGGGLLRTVNELMSEWRGRTVVVADLAAELGLSVSRLRVLFGQTAGVPLGSYVRNYRLNRAMALLRTTDLPISEVAEEAGFGSPQAFSRIFKAKIGRTPRDYRSR